MANLKSFEKDLDKFAKKLGIGVETVVRKISFDVFTGIVKKTPVDKGRARASWTIGINRPVSSPRLGKDEKLSAAEASNYAAQELTELASINPFDSVFINNSLPYIKVLEDGSSTRPPVGMVQVTLTEIKANIKRTTDEF